MKADVKRAVASTQRGKKATGAEQREILRKVEALEASNPVPEPARNKLLYGRWSLLYTGPGRDDDTTWEQRTGGVEGPVIAALRPLNANIVRGKGITQVIAKDGTVQNIAEFQVGGVSGQLNVGGTVAPSGDGRGGTRVDVRFTAFSLKLGALPELSLPLDLFSPTGWVETTYLDVDFRVGRGDKGSVFVTARQGKAEEQAALPAAAASQR
ncbi:hypothetical protein WJX81_001545 [Elliptochloris bilobata]|uniref:Plastid lipid-associated protein/fibrillin conserved domain-containing protein n=1 Tax=Elliptochloris bilobata TaxID=381761 RepID=A0AAW1RYQ4_9CHLO